MNELITLILLLALLAVPVMRAVNLNARGVAWNALTEPVDAWAPPYGALAYFALDGDTVETETVSETDAPAGSVLTDWKELGCIETGSIGREIEAGQPIWCFDATNGWHYKQTSGGHVTLIVNLTLQKVTPFLLQMSRHADSYDGTTGAFTHADQASDHYLGYLLLNQYNDTELVVSELVRAELRMTNPMEVANRQGVKPQVQLRLLKNSNNTGAVGTTT